MQTHSGSSVPRTVATDKTPNAPGKSSPEAPEPAVTPDSWAKQCWEAWYNALNACSGPGHKLADDPAQAICDGLSKRYAEDPVKAVKYVKEQTTWFTARVLGQPPDMLPHLTQMRSGDRPGIFGGGWVFRLQQRFLSAPLSRTDSPRMARVKIQMALNVLMSKLYRPPVSKAMVDAVLEKYMSDMTSPHHLLDPEGWRPRIESLIEKICEKAFGGVRFQPRDFIPSLNACHESGRGAGGCFGQLLRGFTLSILRSDGGVVNLVDPTGDVSAHVSTRDFGVTIEQEVPLVGSDLVQPFSEYVQRLISDLIERGGANTIPFPIVEPDKVRVITEEEAALAYVCLNLQQFMHSTLRQIPALCTIGQPLDPELFSQHFSKWRLGETLYVSGDYEGATNNLDPALSEFAFRMVCKYARCGEGTLEGSVWEKAGLMDLTGHFIQKRGLLEFSQQKWGQMMGSPTSFPILCLINLAASACSQGWDVEELFRSDSEILINGDDVALAITGATPEDVWVRYRDWCKATQSCGLSQSLGKNYVSTRFLIMNSECFMTSDGHSWTYVPFLNQALLMGYEKKGLEAGKDIRKEMAWWELGPRQRELIRGCGPTLSLIWGRAFARQHLPVIQQIPTGILRGASTALGGAGLLYDEYGQVRLDRPKDEAKAMGFDMAVAYHTWIACLSEEQRVQELSRPPRQRRSPLENALVASEEHYRAFVPAVAVEREPMDIILEDWGFPVQREKSALGSALRLAYVLRWFVNAATIALTTDAGFPPGFGEELPDGQMTGVAVVDCHMSLQHPFMPFWPFGPSLHRPVISDDKGLDEWTAWKLSSFHAGGQALTIGRAPSGVSLDRRLESVNQRIGRAIRKFALGAVCRCGQKPGCTRIHPMTAESLKAWKPPCEIVTLWERLGTEPRTQVWFGEEYCPSRKRRRERHRPAWDQTPTSRSAKYREDLDGREQHLREVHELRHWHYQNPMYRGRDCQLVGGELSLPGHSVQDSFPWLDALCPVPPVDDDLFLSEPSSEGLSESDLITADALRALLIKAYRVDR